MGLTSASQRTYVGYEGEETDGRDCRQYAGLMANVLEL